jgi:hypothetical protein
MNLKSADDLLQLFLIRLQGGHVTLAIGGIAVDDHAWRFRSVAAPCVRYTGRKTHELSLECIVFVETHITFVLRVVSTAPRSTL